MEGYAEGPTILSQLEQQYDCLLKTADVQGSPTVSIETSADNKDGSSALSFFEDEMDDLYISVSQMVANTHFTETVPSKRGRKSRLLLPREEVSGNSKVGRWLQDTDLNCDDSCIDFDISSVPPVIQKSASYRSRWQQVPVQREAQKKSDAKDFVDPYEFVSSQKEPRKRGRPPRTATARKSMTYGKRDLKRHFKDNAYDPGSKRVTTVPAPARQETALKEDTFPLNLRDEFDKLIDKSPVRKLPRTVDFLEASPLMVTNESPNLHAQREPPGSSVPVKKMIEHVATSSPERKNLERPSATAKDSLSDIGRQNFVSEDKVHVDKTNEENAIVCLPVNERASPQDQVVAVVDKSDHSRALDKLQSDLDIASNDATHPIATTTKVDVQPQIISTTKPACVTDVRDVAIQCCSEGDDITDSISKDELSYVTRIKLRRVLEFERDLPCRKFPFYLLGPLSSQRPEPSMHSAKSCQTDIPDSKCHIVPPSCKDTSIQTCSPVEVDHRPPQPSMQIQEVTAAVQEMDKICSSSNSSRSQPDAGQTADPICTPVNVVSSKTDMEQVAMDSEVCFLDVHSVHSGDTPFSQKPSAGATKRVQAAREDRRVVTDPRTRSGDSMKKDKLVCGHSDPVGSSRRRLFATNDADVYSPSPSRSRRRRPEKHRWTPSDTQSSRFQNSQTSCDNDAWQSTSTPRRKYVPIVLKTPSEAALDAVGDDAKSSGHEIVMLASDSDSECESVNVSRLRNRTTSKEIVPETEDVMLDCDTLFGGLAAYSFTDVSKEPPPSAKDVDEVDKEPSRGDATVVESLDLGPSGNRRAAECESTKDGQSQHEITGDEGTELPDRSFVSSVKDCTSQFPFSGMSTATEYLTTQDRRQLQEEIDKKQAAVKLMEEQLKSESIVATKKLNTCKNTDVSSVKTAPCQSNGEPKLSPSMKTSREKRLRNLVFTVSGLSPKESAKVQEMAKMFNAKWTDTIIASSTHLIIKTDNENVCCRTKKYVMALAKHCWIVSMKWAIDCLTSGCLLGENDYEVFRDNTSIGERIPRISRLSTTSIFADHEFHRYVPLLDISCDDWVNFVSFLGATNVTDPSLFSYLPNRKPYIIGMRDSMDTKDCNKLYQRYRIPIVDHNWVYDSMSAYKLLPVESYLLMTNGNFKT